MTARFRRVAFTLLIVLIVPHRVVVGAEPPTAQQLRQELQQLRTEYETRLRQIERQLEQLEAKEHSASRPVTMTNIDAAPSNPDTNRPARLPSLPLDPENARRQFLTEQFQPDTESRDIARGQDRERFLRDRLEKVLSEFVDFSGYFRAGYGRNSEGGIQEPFKAPGAGSKYRLGNETENYGELALGKSFFVPGLFSTTAPSSAGVAEDPAHWGPVARFQFRLAFSNPYSGGTDFSVPESWASLGNLIGSQREMKFWAGNRFYRRHDIHVSDFYFYNMSGKGAGVEDFDLGFAKMALAWIGESSQDATYGDVILPDPANKSGFAKSNWDLRLYDLAAPLGKVEIGVTLASSEGGRDEAGDQVDDALGVGLNVVHTAEGFMDDRSVNKLSLQIANGPARTFSSGFELYPSQGSLYILPELRESWRARLTEHFILQPYEWFSIGPVLAYEYTDFGEHGAFGGTRHWFSAGVRPIIQFTRNLGIAMEGGVDWTDSDGRIDNAPDGSGALWKITVAPQVSLDRFFLSRPVLRFYVTYAGWSDAYQNTVGGIDYVGETSGLGFGVQMEAWW